MYYIEKIEFIMLDIIKIMMFDLNSRQDAFEIVKQVLVPMFYNESQIGRSFRSVDAASIRFFKKELLHAILELASKVDDGSLTNNDIRNYIRAICEKTCGSVGQAQKVINVYLKYYTILTKTDFKIFKQLDCPLDSKIMSKYAKQFGLRQTSLRLMTDMNTYETWQRRLEKNGKSLRLKADLLTYDPGRITKYLITPK